MEAAGLTPRLFSVPGEPTVEDIEAGSRLGRELAVQGVAAVGGGSAIDAGKAIAALVTNPGEVADYLEVVGRGQTLSQSPLPFAAIPTTAGTGAEATRNAVLMSTRHRLKVSLRSAALLPRLAVVDPELSYGLPPRPTAATGIDALTQLIEPFLSCRANPMTDALCRAGLVRVGRSLRIAYATAVRLDPLSGSTLTEEEKLARHDMALAALWSGMALANAGLGAVHGLAGPIGGRFGIPHGAVCAALLPHVLDVNLHALRMRAPGSRVLDRFDEIARLLTGDLSAQAEGGLDWVGSIVRELQIPGLATYGLASEHMEQLVEDGARSSSMKGNPIPLTPDEVAGILTRAQ
jgi:alcohol dehydrogenase class IV